MAQELRIEIQVTNRQSLKETLVDTIDLFTPDADEESIKSLYLDALSYLSKKGNISPEDYIGRMGSG